MKLKFATEASTTVARSSIGPSPSSFLLCTYRYVVPIRLAGLPSLHPVWGAAERDDDPGPRPPHHIHPPVQGGPVVLAGAWLGVAASEAHNVLVLGLKSFSHYGNCQNVWEVGISFLVDSTMRLF